MKIRNLIFLLVLGLVSGCNQTPQLTDYVNTLVGTGGHGHTFPGATLPFGMVQLSPDTRIDGSWDGCGGYHYSDSVIYGFSHTHLSGTGVSDYGDIMMMPLVEDFDITKKTYESNFSHKNEKSSPGFYSVKLDNGIFAELTTSLRAGFHRYTFPKGKTGLVIDLHHRDVLIEGKFELIDPTTIAIKRISSAWATEQHAYAYVQFSAPYTAIFNADSTKMILDFRLNGQKLLVKTGFSFVSTEGAKRNVEKEIPHWGFNTVKEEANKIWNKELSKIEVESNQVDKLKIFYTALYHVMIQPNLAMDVDRNYRGRDNKIHQATDFDYYTVFSLWDTFRAAHPLYTLLDRKRTSDFIKTFLKQYEQGGRLPVWEFASNETDCMIGYHSVSVIADAAAKGITDFDMKLAFEAMKKSANWNHLGLPAYIKNGFINIEDEHESVSKTLEYAYDDWCIAQMAKMMKDDINYYEYMERSQSWKNLLDPTTTFMRPRKNGGWIEPFEAREVNNYFTEGNSWQYSFFVPHDVYGLIDRMGGKTKFEAKLDELFNTSTQTTGRTQVDITGLIGQYAHGNEPSHHMAFLYHYVGRPDKTTEKVNKILTEFYTPNPDGLIGNEDCGQMSAWYVLSSLGLYQINPGSDYFIVHAPHFEKATIHLESGKQLSIIANNYSEKSIYTQAVSFNNQNLKPSSSIKYQQIIDGGELKFEMSEKPKTFEDSDLPPAEETVETILTAPIISSSKRAFIDTLVISLSHVFGTESIYYTMDGSDPSQSSNIYTGPIIIDKTLTFKAISIGKNGDKSGISVANFYKKPNNFTINILSKYNPQYSAGGMEGLIDGIYGNENWRKGDWQGYQSQDFEAIIDLQKPTQIKAIASRYLQDTRSWIIFPKQVEYYVSMDGVNFTKITELKHQMPADDYDVVVMTLEAKMPNNTKARFVKVKAINFGILPKWHLGAGFDAFIFIDEIIIK